MNSMQNPLKFAQLAPGLWIRRDSAIISYMVLNQNCSSYKSKMRMSWSVMAGTRRVTWISFYQLNRPIDGIMGIASY